MNGLEHSVKVSNQGAVWSFKCPISQCLRNKGVTDAWKKQKQKQKDKHKNKNKKQNKIKQKKPCSQYSEWSKPHSKITIPTICSYYTVT